MKMNIWKRFLKRVFNKINVNHSKKKIILKRKFNKQTPKHKKSIIKRKNTFQKKIQINNNIKKLKSPNKKCNKLYKNKNLNRNSFFKIY